MVIVVGLCFVLQLEMYESPQGLVLTVVEEYSGGEFSGVQLLVSLLVAVLAVERMVGQVHCIGIALVGLQ